MKKSKTYDTYFLFFTQPQYKKKYIKIKPDSYSCRPILKGAIKPMTWKTTKESVPANTSGHKGTTNKSAFQCWHPCQWQQHRCQRQQCSHSIQHSSPIIAKGLDEANEAWLLQNNAWCNIIPNSTFFVCVTPLYFSKDRFTGPWHDFLFKMENLTQKFFLSFPHGMLKINRCSKKKKKELCVFQVLQIHDVVKPSHC